MSAATTTDLKAICIERAADVRSARASLGNACRRGTPEDITAARQALGEAKIARLAADSDYIRAGLPITRDLVLISSDGDPSVSPSRENHAALESAQRLAVAAFTAANPIPRDPEDDGWDRETRTAYKALLASHVAAHSALGCSVDAPCRVATQ